jgi:hypothetical protein
MSDTRRSRRPVSLPLEVFGDKRQAAHPSQHGSARRRCGPTERYWWLSLCQGCSGWFSLGDLADVTPGGRRGAPSGLCTTCFVGCL